MGVQEPIHTPEISIHPLRGEWDKERSEFAVADKISIHPLRGEWDV